MVIAKQANVTTGPQQVNNGVAVPGPSRARENEIEQSKLLEAGDGQRLDTAAAGAASGGGQALAPVGAIHRTDDPRRQG